MIEGTEWPLRPVLLAGLGAVAGLALHVIMPVGDPPTTAQIAAAAFVAVGATALGFTLERARWTWSALFALAAASLFAGVAAGSGPLASWSASDGWHLFCAALAILIAAPLLQTARDEGRARFPYEEVHAHAWINAIIGGAAWAFAGLAFGLAHLLAALFDLIGISLLEELLRRRWVNALLLGAALGAAIGLLRERERIVRTLQAVVMAVLRVLAPVLGIGLALFLLSLPFTGLAPLWSATKSTTPIVLSAMIAALLLANSVIGNGRDDEAANPALRIGGLLLSLSLLPLALIAAVSVGQRIAQHGLSVDRLWALTFVIVATAYGVAYLGSIVRHSRAWIEGLRETNLRLAFGLCGVLLLLALPVLGFNTIATNNQLVRLASGQVSAERFDWAALRFDFGEPGRRAVERLARGNNPRVAALAQKALGSNSRYEVAEDVAARERVDKFSRDVRVLPARRALPPALREALARNYSCVEQQRCVIVLGADGREAAVARVACKNCEVTGERFVLTANGWQRDSLIPRVTAGTGPRVGFDRGEVEIREVKRRQLFVGGVPVGEDF